jgi:glucose-1-phosphate thymidylyltransferase
MKGIILAGGLGTRLHPFTQHDNKHLLPVYDKRMVEFPLRTLIDAGIDDIILITGGQQPGKFLEIFKNGKSIGANRLYYTYQEGEGGIADALKMARPFMRSNESCAVILGDNYFEDGILPQYKTWNRKGAQVFLKEVDALHSPYYGIAETEGSKIIGIEEKPPKPKTNLAIVGCYLFDHTLWDKLENVKPSVRNELEITDVLKFYMEEDKLGYSSYEGYWKDMGTFDTWMEVSKRVHSRWEKEPKEK